MSDSLGRVLMFVENNFPGDPRVKNEADTLTAAGYSVTVVGLREKGDTETFKVVDNIRVYSIPRVSLFSKTRKDNPVGLERLWLRVIALMGYMWEYMYFTGACFVMSLYVAMKQGFDVSMPTTLPIRCSWWRHSISHLGKSLSLITMISAPNSTARAIKQTMGF